MVRGRHALYLAILLVLFLAQDAFAASLSIATNETDASEPAISANITETTTFSLSDMNCARLESLSFTPSSNIFFNTTRIQPSECKAYTGTQFTGTVLSASTTSVDTIGKISCVFITTLTIKSTRLVANMSARNNLTDISTSWTGRGQGTAACDDAPNSASTSMSLLAPGISASKEISSDTDYVYLNDNMTQKIKVQNVQDSTHHGMAKGVTIFLTSYNSSVFSVGSLEQTAPSPLISGSQYVGSFETNKSNTTGSYNFTYIANDTTGVYNSTLTRTLQIVNLTIQNNITTEDKTFGSTIELKAKIDGNATAVETVTANVSYNEVQNGQVVARSQLLAMQLKEATGTAQIYNASFTVNHSYAHTITYSVTDTYQYTATDAVRQKGVNTTASFFVNS